MPDLSFETAAGAPHAVVAGVDEAGRGPLAGPVFAVACVLPAAGLPAALATAIDDSKRLRPERRAALAPDIQSRCAVGIGRAAVEEIDRLNILRATELAMQRALADLSVRPEVALIDGNRVPPELPCAGRAVVGGDRLCLSIAAASIVAKVLRDRHMISLARTHPEYGWDRNMGYGTAEHRQAIARLGLSPHHRRSFRLREPDPTRAKY